VLGCVAVGGRLPTFSSDPVVEIVWPHWRGAAEQRVDSFRGDPVPQPAAEAICPLCRRHPPSFLAAGRQFEWNLGRWLMERSVPAGKIPPEPSPWQSLQMAPLVAFWLLMVGMLIWRRTRVKPKTLE
jgi:hypothetical protein